MVRYSFAYITKWEKSLFVTSRKNGRNVESTCIYDSYVLFGRDVAATSFLRPRRIRTSGKLAYRPKVGRPLNVCGRLAEWEKTHP